VQQLFNLSLLAIAATTASTSILNTMPDSPNSPQIAKNSADEDEVELLEAKKAANWPHQALADLRNNNNQLFHHSQPRLTSEAAAMMQLRPPMSMINHHPAALSFPPRFGLPGSQPPPGMPPFPGWLYRGSGLHPPPPLPGYPLGRGHELMRRLCTMNPAFASSIIEDYIRPQVILKYYITRVFIYHVFSSIDSVDLARHFKTDPTETVALCFGIPENTFEPIDTVSFSDPDFNRLILNFSAFGFGARTQKRTQQKLRNYLQTELILSPS
jgi:hypothetical protein